MTALDGHSTLFSAARFGHPSTTQNRRSQPQSRSEAPDNDRFWEVETADPSSCSDRRFFNVFVFPKLVASFAWWRGFCSAPWRSCCRDHAGLAAGWCRGLNREGCARSGPFGSLPLRQSPKAPPLTRITMPRPMRTMGKRMCSQRSSTSAIGGRVATNFARATRTATSARKTMQ